MKHTLTLSVLLWIFTIVSFGQEPRTWSTEKFKVPEPEQLSQAGKALPNVFGVESLDVIEQKVDYSLSYLWNETSSQWVITGKTAYTFDANRNRIQETSYTWNETSSQWVITRKTEFTYNANGNQTQLFFYTWNETSSQWVEILKYEFTYNANGYQTQSISYTWNKTTSQWVENNKRESTFDANGKLTQQIDYTWNETSSQWVENIKFENTYNANGDQTQSIYYNWNKTTSQWVIIVKTELTFDASGNNTQQIKYTWNETSSQWVITGKTEITYDANGNNTQYASYTWNETTSQWVGSLKTEFTYNANGDRTQYASYTWNETSSQWVITGKTESTFDANGELTQQINYTWNETSSQCVGHDKSVYYYSKILTDTTIYYVADADFEQISPKVYLESIDSLKTNIGGCDSIIHRYSKYEFLANHYTDTITTEVFDTTHIAVTDTLIIDVTITGMNPPENTNTVKVYPNPAKDFIYINTGTNYQNMTNHKIKIISSSGLLVFETFMDQQLFQINVNDFGQTGLYLIQIIDNSNNIIDTRKIVLQ